MFKPSLYSYSTRLQMVLDIPLQHRSTRQKYLSILGTKILSKVNPSIKNDFYACCKEKYFTT